MHFSHCVQVVLLGDLDEVGRITAHDGRRSLIVFREKGELSKPLGCAQLGHTDGLSLTSALTRPTRNNRVRAVLRWHKDVCPSRQDDIKGVSLVPPLEEHTALGEGDARDALAQMQLLTLRQAAEELNALHKGENGLHLLRVALPRRAGHAHPHTDGRTQVLTLDEVVYLLDEPRLRTGPDEGRPVSHRGRARRAVGVVLLSPLADVDGGEGCRSESR
mmetsp:Transcript_29226/g.72825  ORF Transcript_29226/g.72825 Transcript_29226/m.72825 type:complete len:218 (-) Transcript_29226:144-797(-)